MIRKSFSLLVSSIEVTERYPDPIAKPILPKRFRGFLAVDTHKCTLCGECTKICPSDAISIDQNNFTLKIDYTRCMSCTYCINTCTERALVFSNRFEGATNNKDVFVYNFNIINTKNINREL